jgi:hypothetical protein
VQLQVFVVEHLVPISLAQFAQNRVHAINLEEKRRKMNVEIEKACDLKVKLYNAVNLIEQISALFKDNAYVLMAIADST